VQRPKAEYCKGRNLEERYRPFSIAADGNGEPGQENQQGKKQRSVQDRAIGI
jgi:hypothetical protein